MDKLDNDFEKEGAIGLTMRRSPKALDRDRQLVRLIAKANDANERRAKRRLSRFEKVLFDGGPAPEGTTPHLGKNDGGQSKKNETVRIRSVFSRSSTL